MNKSEIISWNGLKAVKIENTHAKAIITLQGAHIASYIPVGSTRDVLFLSEKCLFQKGKCLRGGVPVCWPWFGQARQPGHGPARFSEWNLDSISACKCGGTVVKMSYVSDLQEFSSLKAEIVFRISNKLTMELTTVNNSSNCIKIEEALHTYFKVGDIRKVTVSGLAGAEYLDKVGGKSEKKKQTDENIVIDSEVDRVYSSCETACINDAEFQRKIIIEKKNSASTVVWNPWIEKSIKMADFCDEEYFNMICVETANAVDGAIMVKPFERHTMTAVISVESYEK